MSPRFEQEYIFMSASKLELHINYLLRKLLCKPIILHLT